MTAEFARLRERYGHLERAYKDLRNVHDRLKTETAGEMGKLRAKLEDAHAKLREVNMAKENFVEPPAKKPYSELKATQRALVNNQLKGNVQGCLSTYEAQQKQQQQQQQQQCQKRQKQQQYRKRQR